MEERIKRVEQEIEAIKHRNKSVENDKAWEGSKARIVSIALTTYIIVVVFFVLNDLPKPFLNSLVPMIGYVLSTQTLPVIKRVWVKSLK